MAYRKGEFPEAFERLCAMSIKPVSSLRFKRDCLAAWERRVAQGFAPEHIIEAYCAYAKSYWMRNGDDATLAKNLARWLEGEGGLSAYADRADTARPARRGRRTIGHAGSRSGRPRLREALAARGDAALRHTLDHGDGGELPPEEDVLVACETDRHYQRFLGACRERYDRYLKVIELFRSPSASLARAREEAVALSAMPFGGRLS